MDRLFVQRPAAHAIVLHRVAVLLRQRGRPLTKLEPRPLEAVVGVAPGSTSGLGQLSGGGQAPARKQAMEQPILGTYASRALLSGPEGSLSRHYVARQAIKC